MRPWELDGWPRGSVLAMYFRRGVAQCQNERGVGLAEFLIDTGRRVAPDANRSLGRTSLRPAKSLSISSITIAELLYGARLREDDPVPSGNTLNLKGE